MSREAGSNAGGPQAAGSRFNGAACTVLTAAAAGVVAPPA